MPKLFDRRINITANGVSVTGDTIVAGRAKPGFRCTFQVVQTLTGEHQQADCCIYNLGESARRQIETTVLSGAVPAANVAGAFIKAVPATFVERNLLIEAGYEDDDLVFGFNKLFDGKFIRAENIKGPTEWETQIKAVEGHSAKYRVVNKAFARGQTAADVVAEVVRVMGVDGSDAIAALVGPEADISTQTFAHARSIAGTAKQVLTRLGREHDFDWGVQGNKLRIVFRHSTASTLGVDMSEDHGLINAPIRFVDNKDPKGIYIRFTSLLNAALFPSQAVKLRSRQFDGVYKVVKARHFGDTWGQAWHSEIEALALSGAKL